MTLYMTALYDVYRPYAIYIRMRMSVIARYVYTYEEFVIVTEAPQCNRMTATGQDTDNKNNNIYTK